MGAAKASFNLPLGKRNAAVPLLGGGGGGTRRGGALSRGEVAPSPGGLSAPKGSVATRQVARRQQRRSGQPGTGGEAGVSPRGCHRRWPLAWLEHRVPVPSSEGSASAAGPCPQVIFLPALCINQMILQARGKGGWKTSVAFPHSFSNYPCNIFFCTPPAIYCCFANQEAKPRCFAKRKPKDLRRLDRCLVSQRLLPRLPSCGFWPRVCFSAAPEGVTARMLPAVPRG